MENTNKYNKHIALVITLIALIMAGFLIYIALKNNSIYYYSPSDFKTEINKADSKIKNHTLLRLGGLVKKKSLVKKNNHIYFTLTDGKSSVNIIYKGVLPDLFKENAGAIVEGLYSQTYKDHSDSLFTVSKVLAKHDENYKPPADYYDNLKKKKQK